MHYWSHVWSALLRRAITHRICRLVLTILSVTTLNSEFRRSLSVVPPRCCLSAARPVNLSFCTSRKKRKKQTSRFYLVCVACRTA